MRLGLLRSRGEVGIMPGGMRTRKRVVVSTRGVREVGESLETRAGIGNPRARRFNVGIVPGKGIPEVTVTMRRKP
jgi:hypothetical protein